MQSASGVVTLGLRQVACLAVVGIDEDQFLGLRRHYPVCIVQISLLLARQQ